MKHNEICSADLPELPSGNYLAHFERLDILLLYLEELNAWIKGNAVKIGCY